MTKQEIRDKAPDGTTHIDHMGRYWDLPNGLVFHEGAWVKDNTDFACIWKPLK